MMNDDSGVETQLKRPGTSRLVSAQIEPRLRQNDRAISSGEEEKDCMEERGVKGCLWRVAGYWWRVAAEAGGQKEIPEQQPVSLAVL